MKKVVSILLAVLMVTACISASGCTKKEATDVNQGSAASATAADSDLAYIQQKGTLVVGITEYEPMNYLDAEGKWTGFDTEFAEAVAAKLGVKAEFIVIDWDNKIHELNSKSIDCVWNGMTLVDEVKESMNCTNPYVENAQVVVMKKDKLDQYKTVEDIKDLKIAVEAGSAGAKAAESAGVSNIVKVAAQSDTLMEVNSGSADACIIDITMAGAMTGENTSYASLGYALKLNVEEYGIGFRKGSDVTEKVNGIMSDLVADGTLTDLAKKYELTLIVK